MDELERNRRLHNLVAMVIDKPPLLELVKSMVEKDTESMQMTFNILVGESPIANFLGLNRLVDVVDNTECDECEGTGSIRILADGPWEKCDKCEGTGFKQGQDE